MLIYYNPWIDIYKDYRGEKHIVLWYNDLKGERKFIDLLGDHS